MLARRLVNFRCQNPQLGLIPYHLPLLTPLVVNTPKEPLKVSLERESQLLCTCCRPLAQLALLPYIQSYRSRHGFRELIRTLAFVAQEMTQFELPPSPPWTHLDLK